MNDNNKWSLENFYEKGGFVGCLLDRIKSDEERKRINSKEGSFTIDSCYTFDMGFETAIKNSEKSNRWIIVQRYSTESDMKKGHQKWVEYAKKNPIEAYSIDFDEYESF